MGDERHESADRVAEYPAREPSIPETHNSIELTDRPVVGYDRTGGSGPTRPFNWQSDDEPSCCPGSQS